MSRFCITDMPDGLRRSLYRKRWGNQSDRWYIHRVWSYIERDSFLMSESAIQSKYNVSEKVIKEIVGEDIIV